MLLHGIQTIAG